MIEAGLGGRLDATNVLPSRVTALTSIGLEHTEWLGDTEVEIAAEKLAVLRDHSTLVVGPLSAEVAELAARDRGRAPRRAAGRRPRPRPGGRAADAAPYLRRNFAVALAAAEALLGALDPERVARASPRRSSCPAAMEVVDGDPPLVLDAAHNPAGAAALAEALPGGRRRAPGGRLPRGARRQGRRRDRRRAGAGARRRRRDGDPGRAAGERRPARARGPWRAASLAAVAREAGIGWVEEEPDPAAAIARARSVARAQGGVLLVTGSHYLLRYAA